MESRVEATPTGKTPRGDPGGVVATKKFADEKPELVAKWLEGYQRGVDYMIDNPRESAKHLGKYFREKCGINLPTKSA